MRYRVCIMFVNEIYLSQKGSVYNSLSAQTDHAVLSPLCANRNKCRLLFSSVEMFNKPLRQNYMPCFL